jgi:hypothetical protein
LVRAGILSVCDAIIIQVGAASGCQRARLIRAHVLVVGYTVAIAVCQPDRLDAD